jgi:hypothetical protein
MIRPVIGGTATGGSGTTVVHSALDIEADVLNDKIIKITIGGTAYIRKITDSGASTITFAALVSDVQATCVVKAASAATDKLTITAVANQGTTPHALGVLLTTAADDSLAVTKTDGTGTINIALANTTASKNTAALIQTAVRALGTVGGVDVSNYTCTAGGDWDTAAVATGEAGRVAFSGGVDAVEAGAGTIYEVYM